MAFGSESASEREDRLEKQEERLHRQHERIKEARSMPSSSGGGGVTGTSGGKIGQYVSEHRWEFVIGIIATVIVGYIFYRANSGNAGTSGTSGNAQAGPAGSANDQGNLATAGYQTQGVSYGLDQITQQLDNLTTMIGNPPAGASGATGATGPSAGAPVPAKWSLAPVLPAGTKVWQGSNGEWDALTPGGTKYMLLGPKSALGQGVLPQGTQIERGGTGRYWYVEPGQFEQALVPTTGYTGTTLGISTGVSGIQQINTPATAGTPGTQ
jgi:hypothetical protein